ncbi:hypothetical protein VQ02_19995 [Methylobacterium variabile]|uniref:Uncharacterized protein n=1 Tax=Methylobacterium variabile TaxID=298794 RepID=A0A0J6SJT7_9HYPH|nr:hypothetical protein [Methylobacterium variabile]KMO33917.1 hypothetical protein VQ02_19995 [Methylobacterium variabile]
MPTRILSIQPRRQDIRTSASEDWTDVFPLYQAGPAAVVAGAGNAGNGALTVSAVGAYVTIGPHVVAVVEAGALVVFSVTDPAGTILGRGLAGTTVQVGGLSLTLSPGSQPFAAGDAWGVQPSAPLIDDTGIDYVLQVRSSQTSPVVTLEATSQPPGGTLQTLRPGAGTGLPSLIVPYTMMSPARFPPGPYVYELLALADGRRKSAYFGNLEHVDGVAYLP